MKTFTTEIKTPHGFCDVFVAHPQDGKTHPGVIMYMDAYGVRPYLHSMAEKLASHGYYVILPNLFYQTKKAPVFDVQFPLKEEDLPEARKKIMPLVQSFDHKGAVQDAKALLDFLKRQEEVGSIKFGISGYCMGGGLALRVAATYPDQIAAVASFHGGRLATSDPDSPHRKIKNIRAKLYFGHADNDASIPPEQIERLNQHLTEAHLRYHSEVYRGAKHGFTMMDLPAGDESALQLHWDRLLQLFDQELYS